MGHRVVYLRFDTLVYKAKMNGVYIVLHCIRDSASGGVENERGLHLNYACSSFFLNRFLILRGGWFTSTVAAAAMIAGLLVAGMGATQDVGAP